MNAQLEKAPALSREQIKAMTERKAEEIATGNDRSLKLSLLESREGAAKLSGSTMDRLASEAYVLARAIIFNPAAVSKLSDNALDMLRKGRLFKKNHRDATKRDFKRSEAAQLEYQKRLRIRAMTARRH